MRIIKLLPIMKSFILLAIFLAVSQVISTSAAYGNIPSSTTIVEGSRQFIYNENQRLIRVVDDGVTKGEYTYDAKGQRVKKIAGGFTTIFHYDQNSQLIAESDGTGHITTEYVYLNGQPFTKIEGANTYYYHNDHLGTPQKMTDASGNVVWAADYTPFGAATITESTITNNLRGMGQYFDQETGLIYNHFRDLNPQTGRYLEADPIGQRGDIDPYVYVGNNPVNWVDPLGLITTVIETPVGPVPFYVPTPNQQTLTPQQWEQMKNDLALLNPIPLVTHIIDTTKDWYNYYANSSAGFWPGDKGAAEWGRRNGVGPQEGKRRFHRGVKQQCPGSKATDKYTVNPETGDVKDQKGDVVGNLADVRAK